MRVFAPGRFSGRTLKKNRLCAILNRDMEDIAMNTAKKISGAKMRISVIIPTLNAGGELTALMERLRAQTTAPDEIIVVDSQSTDDTVQRAKDAGATVIPIARKDFDHGGTRDMAIRKSSGDVVIMMTQDAMPDGTDAMERLIAPLSDPRVAAVGGRQVPKADARAFERLVREHNYPAESRVWDASAIECMGVRAFMISDVFAAYRREAYLAVGGFDHPIMTNEDMLMVQRLLEAGYRIAYAGDACVRHSHNLTMKQQFRRNYIVGRTMQRYEERFCHVQEMGEGTKLAKAVLMQLIKEGHPLEAICFCLDCAARLLGNRLGRRDETKMGRAK